MLVVTAGLWLPLALMYDAARNPWRCTTCGERKEPWHKAIARAAGLGLGGIAIGYTALSFGLIGTRADLGTVGEPKSAPTSERSQEQHDRMMAEHARREQLAAKFHRDRDSIVAEIRSALDGQHFHVAITKADRYLIAVQDPGLLELKKLAQERALLVQTKALPASELGKNLALYRQLAALDPANVRYQRKVAFYQAKLDAKHNAEEAARVAQVQREAARKAEADELVAKFGRQPVQSAWNGSYLEVKRYLEQVANDPDSIEIDGCTKIYHTDSGWLVGCDYRGRNGFGGMVRQSNWFTIRGGRVVAIHEPGAYRM